MTTASTTGQATFAYYLLQEARHQNGDYTPEFSRLLTATVTDLCAADPVHYDLPGNLAVEEPLHRLHGLAADFDHRLHTSESDQLLAAAAHDLAAAHPAATCGWAEDCTVCPALTWLHALTAAYQRLRADATAAPSTDSSTDRATA